jgi:hypothetical protein
METFGLNYNVILTGDCSSTNSGAIIIIPNGGTPKYNVQWLDPDLGVDASTDLSSRTGLSAGTYTILITDSSAPTNNQIFVNVPVSSGVSCFLTSVTNTTCDLNNGTATVSSSSNFSYTEIYLYNSDNTYVTSSTTSVNNTTFQNLTAGTYYMIAQDLGGCTGRSESFIIEKSPTLDYGLYVVPNAACGYTPIGKIYVTGLTGTPPYTYMWNTGDETNYITGLTAGDYSVDVRDYYNCSVIKSGTIVNLNPVQLVAFTANPPSCLTNDGSLTVQLTGGTPPYYYSASTGYVEISYLSTFTLENIGAGPYTVQVTDAAFCSDSIGTTLNTPSGMTSINVETKNTNCSFSEGAITVSIQGGNNPFLYSLTYPDLSVKEVNTDLMYNLFSNLSAGTYNLSVSDSSGCTYMNDYTIYNQNSFSISAVSTSATYGQKNGTVTVTKSTGGTEPYAYILDNKTSISNSILSAVTFYDLSSGQHEVVVVDSVGCKQNVNVYVEYVPVVDFLLIPTSAGSNSGGTITALISSGKPPFTYSWSDNVMDNPQTITVTGLTAGTYSLIVIDSNGSSLKRTTTINGSTSFDSYQSYTVGEQTFELITNTKYSLSKMLNEGFQDLTSGETGCNLSSATFTTRVRVNPLSPEVTEVFYTTYSLLDVPQDNLFYNSIQNLLSSSIGVGEVIIDEINNEITILSDAGRQDLVSSLDVKVYLTIDYDIYCTG